MSTAAPARTEVLDALRQVDLLEDLPAEKLEWLAGHVTERRLAVGEHHVRPGDLPDRFSVLVEGRIEWFRVDGGDREVFGTHEPVTYGGVMSLLTEEPITGEAIAALPSRYLDVPGPIFHQVVRECPSVLRRAVRLFAPNITRFEAARGQREKLESLGGLAAGLAHEIGNPAAAAQRSAHELRGVVRTLRASIPGLVELPVCATQPADPVEVADREDAIGARLEALGVADAWTIAGDLARTGADPAFVEALGDPALLPAAAAAFAAGALLDDLDDALDRVGDLVGRMKGYSHMDQAPVGEVDLHAGLDATLAVLGHRLRAAGIRVERDYAMVVPPLHGAGGRLNQAWTQLLENAIDAAPGGTITVTTAVQHGRVRVTIADDGVGIDDAIRDRVFEPFFSTKDVGATGLGLDVVRRAAAAQGGRVELDAAPGRTAFTVVLPVPAEAS